MSDNVRKLPGQTDRVETGVVQFGDDWPGIFIRGENAFNYANLLEFIVEELPQENLVVMELQGLVSLLRESRVKHE